MLFHRPFCQDTECKDGGDGMFAPRQMTRSAVLRICRERGVFSLPSCNTILYLHQQKFSNISGLEAYTACKVCP